MSNIQIVDCFCYNGEPVIQERLSTMAPFVNRIFIVEAKYTHSGKEKPVFYHKLPENESIFAPYLEKITFLTIDTPFPEMPASFVETQKKEWEHDPNAWFRERYQRNFALHALKKWVLDNSNNNISVLAIVSDVDEIVYGSLLKSWSQKADLKSIFNNNDKPMYLEMEFYYYNEYWKKETTWPAAFVLTGEMIEAVEDLSEIRLQSWAAPDSQKIQKAGKHLSYYNMSKEEFVRKLESFAHVEFNDDKYKSNEWYELCLCTGRDIFNREGRQEKLVPANRVYPAVLSYRENITVAPQSGFVYKVSPDFADQFIAFIYAIEQARRNHCRHVLVDGFIRSIEENAMIPISCFVDLRGTAVAIQMEYGDPVEHRMYLMDRIQAPVEYFDIIGEWYGSVKDNRLMRCTYQLDTQESNEQREQICIPAGEEFNEILADDEDPCPYVVKKYHVHVVLQQTIHGTIHGRNSMIPLEFIERGDRAQLLNSQQLLDHVFTNKRETFFEGLSEGENFSEDFNRIARCIQFQNQTFHYPKHGIKNIVLTASDWIQRTALQQKSNTKLVLIDSGSYPVDVIESWVELQNNKITDFLDYQTKLNQRITEAMKIFKKVIDSSVEKNKEDKDNKEVENIEFLYVFRPHSLLNGVTPNMNFNKYKNVEEVEAEDYAMEIAAAQLLHAHGRVVGFIGVHDFSNHRDANLSYLLHLYLNKCRQLFINPHDLSSPFQIFHNDQE